MWIEEAFRDLKSLLNFHKLMNKHQILMEKMVALVLIAYTIALVLGKLCGTNYSLKDDENRKYIPVLSSS